MNEETSTIEIEGNYEELRSLRTAIVNEQSRIREESTDIKWFLPELDFLNSTRAKVDRAQKKVEHQLE